MSSSGQLEKALLNLCRTPLFHAGRRPLVSSANRVRLEPTTLDLQPVHTSRLRQRRGSACRATRRRAFDPFFTTKTWARQPGAACRVSSRQQSGGHADLPDPGKGSTSSVPSARSLEQPRTSRCMGDRPFRCAGRQGDPRRRRRAARANSWPRRWACWLPGAGGGQRAEASSCPRTGRSTCSSPTSACRAA